MSINQKLAGGFGLSHGPLLARQALKRRYTLPPFSVLNTRDGEWQTRRGQWVALGIQSELGRDVKTYNTKHLTEDKYGKKVMAETSIFDPVLCEVLYSWFCPPKGQIVDPFAGGSVRGVVASVMGYRYWGCDLSKKQIQANQQQLDKETSGESKPVWVQGDSTYELEKAPKCDFLFSCPPYGNLEVYSKDKRDISNMEYEDFIYSYQRIIQKACKRLKPNRFACFVVASFRNKKTSVIHDLVGDTIRAFASNGLHWYNDLVLINACGTAPIRTKNIFENGCRKVVKLHQNVLVFCKGKPPSWDWLEA